MTDEVQQIKPFAAWLQEQRRGGLHGELSDALAEVVQASIEHGKGGTVTLTVKVTPNKDGVTVLTTDEVKTNLPKADPTPSLFFADSRGNLSRQDPRQTELPLREVGGQREADEGEQPASEVAQ